MAFIPAVLTGVSALAGLFGGKKKQTESTNTSTTNGYGSQSYNNFNNPVLSDNQQQLSDTFTRGALDDYRNAPDLSGYTAGGLKQINNSANLRSRLVRNNLASRGLSYSPYAASAEAGADDQRQGDQVNFLDQIPLLQRSLRQDSFNQLLKSFGVLPTATEQKGSSSYQQNSTTNQKGTQIIPGNPTAGFLSGLGAGLAGPSESGGSNLSQIMKALGFGGGGGGVANDGGNY